MALLRLFWLICLLFFVSLALPVRAAFALQAPGVTSSSDHSDHDHDDHDDHGDHAGPISLTPAQFDALDLKLFTLQPLSLEASKRYPVEVQFDPNRVAHLTPLVSGTVREVFVTLGDRVEKGQTLAILDSRDLGEAKSAFLAARASFQLHQQIHDRQKRLFEKEILPEQDYLIAAKELEEMRINYEVAKQALLALGLDPHDLTHVGEPSYAFNRFFMVAPMSGIIAAQHITPGELLDERDKAFEVIAPDEVWALAQIYERDLSFVALGQRAMIRFEALPDRIFQGSVDFIGSALDPATRTVTARVVLDNNDHKLRAGMFGQVTLFAARQAQAEGAFLVPRACLQRGDGEALVFRKVGERSFEKVAVTVVQDGEDFAEVRGSLALGDQLALGDTFVLKSLTQADSMGHGHSH